MNPLRVRPPLKITAFFTAVVMTAGILMPFFQDTFIPSVTATADELLLTAPPFKDLPSANSTAGILYNNAIEVFRTENIIIGDTRGGVPTGMLRPGDVLTRAEFTKVAVILRLIAEDEKGLLGITLPTFTLRLNTLLKPYYRSAGSGAVSFTDIPDKDEHCASEPGRCEPWYTQYINFASSRGMVRGFTAKDGSSYFSPSAPIRRIHALRLAMAGDGNVPADKDRRFIALSADQRIRGRVQRCLAGEGIRNAILDSNGNDTDLLAYALLADRLDLFGNKCQALNEKGVPISLNDPSAVVAWLNGTVTRQEVARWFALTTPIPALRLDPLTDSTVDTAQQYIMPYAGAKELMAETEKIGTNGVKEGENVSYETAVPGTQKQEKTVIYLNRSPAEMSLEELIAIHPQGRCCSTMDLNGYCPVVNFADYRIENETVFNWDTYKGPSWYVARKGTAVCYIPIMDITTGYKYPASVPSQAKTDTAKSSNAAQVFRITDAGKETVSVGAGKADDPWYKRLANKADELNSKITAVENSVKDLFRPVSDAIVIKEAALNEFLKNNPYVSDGVLANYWRTKGAVKSGIDSVSGLYGVIRHPLESGEVFVIALTHPVKTLGAVSDQLGNTIGALLIQCPPRAEECFVTQGQAMGDTAQLLIGGAALKTASKAGALDDMAKIAKATRRSLDDVLSLTKYADNLAAVTAGKKPVHLVKLSGTLENQLEQLTKLCAKAKAGFDKALGKSAAQTGGEAVSAPLKGTARAMDKAKTSADVRAIKDILRGSIVYKNVDDIYNSLEKITRNFDELVEIKDSIRFPSQNANGYRDIKLIFRDKDGIISEVQLIPREIYKAKTIETPLYNITREFPDKADSLFFTPDRRAILEAKAALQKESPAIYAELKTSIDDIIRYTEGNRSVDWKKAKQTIEESSRALYNRAWERQLNSIR